ncbi:uncharacterized protein LOC119898436 [Micropterus salmoides]|uniref:uncharacterized protein LOC119898436 n=1 Tax=Micropterus salmoides TaxID=27706 RepID=UPI0018EC12E4|nr:uncharacterized protein LOC119898436 [Micropterus salmoides]
MAVLCWMAVKLALLMSAGNCLAAVVDQNQLVGIVDDIVNRYRPSYKNPDGSQTFPMFSLAVSIPYNNTMKKYDVNQVLDNAEQVRNTIVNCDVYRGTRVVAATLLKWPNVLNQCPSGLVSWRHVLRQCPSVVTWDDLQRVCPVAIRDGTTDHAEYRTLQHFNTLVNNRDKDDLLLFYVYASPCAARCTNENNTRNILNLIKPIQNWQNYAFVFSKVFKPRQGDPMLVEDLKGALMQLGTSIGLDNIFRCDRVRGWTGCTICSSRGQITPQCLSDEP